MREIAEVNSGSKKKGGAATGDQQSRNSKTWQYQYAVRGTRKRDFTVTLREVIRL